MNEKLTAFLEEEKFIVCDDVEKSGKWVELYDVECIRVSSAKLLINLVLDIVVEEIEKNRKKMVTPAESDEDYQKHGNRALTRGWNHIRTGYNQSIDDIKPILINLKR